MSDNLDLSKHVNEIATFLYQEELECSLDPSGPYLEVYTYGANRLIEFLNSLAFKVKPEEFYQKNIINLEKELAKLKEENQRLRHIESEARWFMQDGDIERLERALATGAEKKE